MAVEKLDNSSGLDLIWKSRVVFAEILYSFRECHDLCVDSKLFDKEVILNIDQCAVDFRQLSLDTVSVANRVSKQWLDTALVLFKNIKELTNREDVLELLGTQARELSYCFKVIAAWARDLGGRFHKAQDGTIREAEEFKKVFEKAVDDGKKVIKDLKEKHDKASKLRKEKEECDDYWISQRVEVSWNPLQYVLSRIGASIAKSSSLEASKLEKSTADELRKAKEELQDRKSQNEKAKFIAGKAAELVQVLSRLESTCEAIAAFWTVEAENFASQGANMAKNQAIMIESLPEVIVGNNIAYWTKAKEEMDRYVFAMSAINNCFNFETEAKRPKTQSVELTGLGISLRVPKSVDVEALKAIQ